MKSLKAGLAFTREFELWKVRLTKAYTIDSIDSPGQLINHRAPEKVSAMGKNVMKLEAAAVATLFFSFSLFAERENSSSTTRDRTLHAAVAPARTFNILSAARFSGIYHKLFNDWQEESKKNSDTESRNEKVTQISLSIFMTLHNAKYKIKLNRSCHEQMIFRCFSSRLTFGSVRFRGPEGVRTSRFISFFAAARYD